MPNTARGAVASKEGLMIPGGHKSVGDCASTTTMQSTTLPNAKKMRAFRLFRSKRKAHKDIVDLSEKTPKISNVTSNGERPFGLDYDDDDTFDRIDEEEEQNSILSSTDAPLSPPSSAVVSPLEKKTKFSMIKTSWFCRTSHFERMCDAAFDIVDADGSGAVDSNELYSGLLLIHLKLGTYAGPAACRPLSRECCQATFEKFDVDRSGTLDRVEFRHVMQVLFANVVFRVAVQWAMTLMSMFSLVLLHAMVISISLTLVRVAFFSLFDFFFKPVVPFLAQTILDGIISIVAEISEAIASLDEHSNLANSTEIFLESTASWCVDQTPEPFVHLTSQISYVFKQIPEAVWSAVPLTILSTILGICVVPWTIFQIDDFFQRIADRRSAAAAAAGAKQKSS
jgi:hypothetical protein